MNKDEVNTLKKILISLLFGVFLMFIFSSNASAAEDYKLLGVKNYD